MRNLDPSFTLMQAESNAPQVQIGDYTYSAGMLNFISYLPTDVLVIGKFCSLANDVVIFAGGEHRSDWPSTYPLRIAFGDPLAGRDGHPTSKGPTIIGNDVLISYRATILSGTRVGDGAIIGAMAVVTRDVPPYTIYAGNPARYIRSRFTEKQIEALLKIKWWDWDIEKVLEFTPLLCNKNIDKFIEQALL